METKTPDLKNKLLVAIRAAVQRQADAIASMQEWERPAPDSAYWKTRLVAESWVKYEPSRWLALPPGGDRNRMPAALNELMRDGVVEAIASGQRVMFVRLKEGVSDGIS
jgi:hypothetical protein